MKKRSLGLASKNMVATSKGRNINNKVVSCSTPEHDSPSRDSDSLCDSDCASPVPFLCTQDGAEGETDVVWNYYTPKSETTQNSRIKNSTPLSRREKKTRAVAIRKESIPRKRALKSTQKKTEIFQDLIELNKNLHKFIDKKKIPTTCFNNGDTDENVLNSSLSPKSGLKTSSRCLRKNLLSSKFSKPESETALESDDSMNECLLKASQIVEEKILNTDPPNSTLFQDSDSLLTNLKLESPMLSKVKKSNTPVLNNDSFDNFVWSLNDSVLERLTQMPLKNATPVKNIPEATSNWVLQDLKIHESSPSNKSFFGRHNSMPESPTMGETSKPSSSGMIFGRHNSMPYDNGNVAGPGDSPIRCTPDEIRKKHHQAREKLLAKRLLPFTSTQASQLTQCPEPVGPAAKKSCFQPRVPSSTAKPTSTVNKDANIKMLIEKKRQEALLKLRRKQNQ